MGLLIAGGVAALGAGAAAYGSAQSAKAANSTNASNAAATNAANYQYYLQSRGAALPGNSYGNAILPTYFGAGEQNSGMQAYNQMQALINQGNMANTNLSGALSTAAPSFAQSLSALMGQYNGSNLQQQLGFAQPVYGANTALAGQMGQAGVNTALAGQNAIHTGLAQTLAQLNTQNAANGFLGNSTFNQNRMASATISAQQQAAMGLAQAQGQAGTYLGQANLQNTQNTYGLQMSNLANMMNPSLLSQGLMSYGQAQSAPVTQGSQNALNAQSLLNFYKLPVQAFNQQNMPSVSPVANGMQIFGGALQAGASAYGTNSALSGLGNQYAPQGNPYTAPGGYAAPGAMTNMNTMINQPSNFGVGNPYLSNMQPMSTPAAAFGGYGNLYGMPNTY